MKPRCAWYCRQMEPYVDAAAQLPPASLLARHLEECDHCQAAWSGLHRLGAELRQALVVPTAPEGLEERAWARLPAARRRPILSAPALRLGTLAAAVVVALLLLRPWPAGPSSRLAANLPPQRLFVPPIMPPVLPKPAAAPPTQPAEHAIPKSSHRAHPDARKPSRSGPSPSAVHGGSRWPVRRGSAASHFEQPPGRSREGASDVNPGEMQEVRPRGLRRVSPRGAPEGSPGRQPGVSGESTLRAPEGRLKISGPAAKPGAHPTPARPIPDLQYLDGSDPALVARWSPLDRREEARLEQIRRRLPPPADDFVRIPFPRIAAANGAGIAAAAREYEKQAKVVDTRLFRKVTLAEKGVALADFCAHLQEQTGVELRASRATADEKVTIFVREVATRDVMRAVARLFGFLWTRSGEDGSYRYELDQDLRSQLIEEELRNRDQNAALLALDAEMQKYRPFLDVSFEELKKRWDQLSEAEKRDVWTKPDRDGKRQLSTMASNGFWGAVQLYFRLTPRDRATLAAGQEVVFRPDAPNPDRRLPAELIRSILQSLGEWKIRDHLTPLTEVPGLKLIQVRLRVDRSELGKLSLIGVTSVEYDEATSGWLGLSAPGRELATGRSPSVEVPDNAGANAALRGRPPFDQIVSLHPKPPCPAVKSFRWTDLNPNMDMASGSLDRSQPYALSADIWEAVHQATGLPVVADSYTHLYPLSRLSVERQPLFDALCTVGDTMGVRWRKDGNFLVCRSTSYYWDKLKEVPNRYLQRWARDRDANSGLPLADFLEMATMSDQQLDSDPVAQGIEHYWHLPEWAWLGRRLSSPLRPNARMLALLTPDQLRRALEPDGIPLRELTPTQQQRVLQIHLEAQEAEERATGSAAPAPPERFAEAWLRALYVPDGRYVAYQQVPFSPSYIYGGRTPEEAKAAQRQFWHTSQPLEVRRVPDGYFSSDFYFVVGKR